MTNADVKIKEALAIGTPKIKWAVTIPRVPGFQSKLSHVLNNKQDYTLWIETLSDLGRVDAGLTLLIVNPKQAGLLAKDRPGGCSSSALES